MKIIRYIIGSLVTGAIGLYLADDFFNYSFALLKPGDVELEAADLYTSTSRIVITGVCFFSVPWLLFLVKKAAELKNGFQHLWSAILIVIFGFVFWRLRIVGLNSEFNKVTDYARLNGTQPKISVSYLEFEIYLLLGLIVGALIAILIFRDRSSPLLG
jgi:hypothetical protein